MALKFRVMQEYQKEEGSQDLCQVETGKLREDISQEIMMSALKGQIMKKKRKKRIET